MKKTSETAGLKPETGGDWAKKTWGFNHQNPCKKFSYELTKQDWITEDRATSQQTIKQWTVNWGYPKHKQPSLAKSAYKATIH